MLKLFTYSIIRACQCFKSEEPTPYILKKSNLSPIAPLIMLKGRGLIHKIYGEMVSTYISKSCFRLLSTSIWDPDLENRSFFNGIHTNSFWKGQMYLWCLSLYLCLFTKQNCKKWLMHFTGDDFTDDVKSVRNNFSDEACQILSVVHTVTTWDKVFKNGSSKICGRQPLKNLKGHRLLKQTTSLQIF